MRKRFGRVSRWAAGTALVATLALSATPAMADNGRGRGRKPEQRREYRQENRRDDSYDRGARRDYQGQWRHPRYRGDARHGYSHQPRVIVKPRLIIRPQVVYRYAPVRHRYLPYPVWCAPTSRVHFHDEEPFFFNASLGVFLSGAQFWIQVGNAPPPGYCYYDPYCHETFYSVAEYRGHCGHHHEPLLQVVALEDGEPYGYYGGAGSGWYD